MANRTRIPPRSKMEEEIGFTRALRVGDRIIVSGTIATEADGSVTPGGAGPQADRCYALIREYIEELGGTMADVVRVRMFVTDIADGDVVSAAFTRALKHACPTGTLVAITALYNPEIKVEIEAEAIVGSAG
jgi:enamine deaminase RidA (YjgF/YER057c/UK114 family)